MEAKKWILYSMIVLSVLLMQGCSRKNNLKSLSPRQVVELYYKARNKGDTELLRQIIYFAPETSEEKRAELLKSAISSAEEKNMMNMFFMKTKTEYEKIIDDNTAEVGVVLKMGLLGIGKRIPFQQLILKKEDGMWKYSLSKYELAEEQLIKALNKDPYDASAIYHLGRIYQPRNPARANRYYKKYCELRPKGFWISKELLDQIVRDEDIEKEEQEGLAVLHNIPEKSPARAQVFWTLGQLFAEHGDYDKAKMYFDKAQVVMDSLSNPSPLSEKRFKEAKQNYVLLMQGLDSDILTELEAKDVYK